MLVPLGIWRARGVAILLASGTAISLIALSAGASPALAEPLTETTVPTETEYVPTEEVITEVPPAYEVPPPIQTTVAPQLPLEPTTQAGTAILRLRFSERRQQEIRVWLEPQARDWILVGLTDNTAAYRTISDNMQSAADAGLEEGGFPDAAVVDLRVDELADAMENRLATAVANAQVL